MKKLIKVDKDFVADIIKSVLLAIMFSLVLILVFAIIVKFTDIGDEVIAPVNIVLKTISLLLGMIFGIKSSSKGALKGGITALLFSLSSYLMFSIINADFGFDLATGIDMLIMLLEGIVEGIVVVNVKGRK